MGQNLDPVLARSVFCVSVSISRFVSVTSFRYKRISANAICRYPLDSLEANELPIGGPHLWHWLHWMSGLDSNLAKRLCCCMVSQASWFTCNLIIQKSLELSKTGPLLQRAVLRLSIVSAQQSACAHSGANKTFAPIQYLNRIRES